MEHRAEDDATVRVIREALDDAAVPLRKLAEAVGLPPTTARRSLLGHRPWSWSEFRSIAALLGTDSEELAGRIQKAEAST